MSVRSIGLTGGIGSGKSTVAQMLVARGAWLVDTDAIARALTAPGGAAMPALAERFGPDIVDAQGGLDRERMRALAFANPDAKRELEGVLHPMIGAEALRQAGLAMGRPVLYDVPLLTESRHWRQRVDRVLVVDCRPETQIARVIARSGWSEQAVARVIAQQAPRAQRRAIADAVICNEDLSLAALQSEVQTLWNIWCGPTPPAAAAA